MKTTHEYKKLDPAGAIRIEWHEDQFYLVGNGNVLPAGKLYSRAKAHMERLLAPPPWIPESKDPDLDAFGRDLADL